VHKTSAWPLALIHAALIVFASLFPFDGWRDQGIDPWIFLSAPLPPPYWTGFDVAVNVAGYVPLGFLLALALLRWGHERWAVLLAALAGALLSLLMEYLQIYLPRRVPSNLDLLLNAIGALAGACAAALLERWGAIDRWSDFRARWFVQDARGALVLLALWPMALLFPAAVPFGLGQVLERLELGLEDMLADTPFLGWLPVRDVPLEPLSPGGELLCVTLGLLIPCLLGIASFAMWGAGPFLPLPWWWWASG
jgi:VanZ family protein